MSNSIFKVPVDINELVFNYATSSPERKSLKATWEAMLKEVIDDLLSM